MASSLPDNPSLSRLRDDARSLQRAVAAADPAALDAIRTHHPRPDIALRGQRFALHDAQLAVARRYGFSGWPALVHYLETAADLSADPSRFDETAADPADRFCALACLRYDETDAPPRWHTAREMQPTLTDAHIWAVAAAADPDRLAALLRIDPALAAAPGGPFGWTPLLYLTYSRVPQTDSLAAATLLLQAGADPNAGYLWRGMSTPFTVLTGVFGEGEQGPRRQPRHPAADGLATLLLRHGAHPVDQQTLYNRMFRPDDSHLRLLFDHGLADAGPSPWEHRLGAAMETRAQMWHRQVDWAAEHGFTERLALLARHGIDTARVAPVVVGLPDDPDQRDADGATALHHAAWSGDLALIRRLLDAGADRTLRDTRFDATPQGWAEYAYQSEAAQLLEITSDH
ncbi:ankyrin repeat domain-containing protein [Mycolicibacterium bacteremicum]|uniref:ankyrin repeat domain-containing protein n=1 Tax=Mycolicibacterium bacteremicum TaxID=564198 RepID=UPI0026EA984C|nr:ankyrin repeat domain-containing protein [Mycolicibacterium bacteremicum]